MIRGPKPGSTAIPTGRSPVSGRSRGSPGGRRGRCTFLEDSGFDQHIRRGELEFLALPIGPAALAENYVGLPY
jgi:hypothetical protein